MNRNRLRLRVRSQKRIPIMVSIAALLLYVVFFWRGRGSGSSLFLDVFLIGAGFVFWLFFFAQFVLPVQSVTDRMRAFDRLTMFITGNHGPAIFIEDGNIHEHKGELQRRGPGVILLDTASAAVLRTPVRFTRSVGPGIVFTEGKETLAGVVDLRLQRKSCGPKENEDPFLPRHATEEFAAYEARQHRRQETRGLTRDGIEVVPTIEVVFRIDARHGEGGTEYGFNTDAVERAIIGRNIDLNQSPETPDRLMEWQWLPVHLAADMWKESVSKFTLDELFLKDDNKPGAIETIRQFVSDRLMLPEACSYDQFGRALEVQDTSGQMILKKEHCEAYAILKDRGIQVTRVEISNLRLPESVEKELLQRWKANWLVQARRERDLVERRRNYVSELGRQDALRDYAISSSRPLSEIPLKKDLSGREILRQMLRGSLELFRREPQLYNLALPDINQMTELLEWIESQPEEGT